MMVVVVNEGIIEVRKKPFLWVDPKVLSRLGHWYVWLL